MSLRIKVKGMTGCEDGRILNVVLLLAHLSLLWKWYCPIGTSLKKNQTINLCISAYLCVCICLKDREHCVELTVVLILPLSVVILSRWCRLAKGFAAPQDSRYRVILTEALIFPPSREGRERKPSRGLYLSVWENR